MTAQDRACLVHLDPLRQSQEQACLQYLNVNHCDDVKKIPEFKDHERRCDPQSLTTEQELLVPAQFLWRCTNGLVPLENLYRAAKAQVALRIAILTAADKDVATKRSLFANVPAMVQRYGSMSEADLQKIPAEEIWTETQQAIYENEVTELNSPAAMFASSAPPHRGPKPTGVKIESGNLAAVTYSYLKQQAENQYHDFICLDAQAKMEILCKDVSSLFVVKDVFLKAGSALVSVGGDAAVATVADDVAETAGSALRPASLETIPEQVNPSLSSEIVSKMADLKSPDGFPLLNGQTKNIIFSNPINSKITIETQSFEGGPLTEHQLTIGSVPKFLNDNHPVSIKLIKIQSPAPNVSALSVAHKIDLSFPPSATEPVSVSVQLKSGEIVNASGDRNFILSLANRNDVIKITRAPSEQEDFSWKRSMHQLQPNSSNVNQASSNNIVESRFGKPAVQTANDLSLYGKNLFHGTVSGFETSVRSGPKNVGTGFGGSGLYVAVGDEAPIADHFANQASKESLSRAQSTGIRLTGTGSQSTKPVVLEGHLNPNKKFTVVEFKVRRDGFPDLKNGILPVNWSNDPMLVNYLNQFNIIKIVPEGLAMDSKGILVIHENAGSDAIIWQPTSSP